MSAPDVLRSSTHSSSDAERLDRVHDLLAPDEAPTPTEPYYLVGPLEDDPVELPVEVYEVLREAVEAMRKGLSVTISPTSQSLTTQQAADILGMSRPTLIKALDADELPYTRSGTHRRIALADVLAYRERRRDAQYAAIDALPGGAGDAEDIEQTLRELREARRTIAKKRRDRRNG